MESVPGSSRMPDSEVDDNSLHSDVAKKRLKDAVVYFEQLLLENDFVATESSSSISEEAMLIGEELYHGAVEMLGEHTRLPGRIHCNRIVQAKLDAYKEELKGLQKDFYAQKVEKLMFIRSEELACGLKPSVTEDDIERAKQKAEECKM
ncbi:hypothetical protein DMN91_010305 [Ooceraea biroi]|uniref:Uncharacterized protein n=1 Tax=Ooceraea biroi TaxID=2015173 RepID=A0A3L8DD32_OOCBI|nr:hypothetical protein DMN91_010305 [Ooceraea biroi]